MWLTKEDFCSKVPRWWNEIGPRRSAILIITAKLRHCRIRIKEWCKTNFHSIAGAKRTLLEELLAIDQLEEHQELPSETQNKRVRIKSDLLVILEEEEVLWKTRSKQNWLKEGDCNTKYFHTVANGRKQANSINVITDDNGVQLSSEDRKRNYFFRYFHRLFGRNEDRTCSMGDWSALFQSHGLPQPNQLTALFNIEEVKKATFQLGGDKAPSPDGFPLFFYQVFWDTVKDDIFKVFTDLYEGNLTTAPIDYSFICLLPKKEGACTATDFRPISLINGIQKIISKVLANRLARELPSIISPSQSAFFKGRLLVDSFVTASELVSRCTKTRKECVCVKADFAKAYDNVN